MRNSLVVVLFAAVIAGPMWAQEHPPAFEACGGYYYARFNVNANVPGIAPSATYNGNGGGGQIEYNVNHWLGAVGDLGGFRATSSGSGSFAGGVFTYLLGARDPEPCGDLVSFSLLSASQCPLRPCVFFFPVFLVQSPRRIISSMSTGVPSTPPLSPHLRIHSINIYVRDQDRSLRFYVDQLGFHLAYDAKLQSGERLVAVGPPDGQAVLSLIAPKPDSLDFKLIGRSTRLTLITEDVLAKYQEWSKRGVRFQHTPRLRRIKFDPETRRVRNVAESPLLGEEAPIWGGVSTRFRDPDGNTFSLVSFDEITHALEAQRRAQAQKLELERRAAQELEIANEVQCRFFPQVRPPIQALDYSGHCFPARAVGGDYYDFLDLGPDRFGLVIGDVSGKGIAAALLMANLQANLRSQCAISLDQPQRLLCAVNQLFSQNTPDGSFATLFLADYHVPTGRLRYINCGHPPALILRCDDSIDRLDPTATVLGIFKKWDCELDERTIHPGDTLVLYTDGITESFNDSRDEYGEARLIESLLRHRHQPSQSLLQNIVADVRQFSPHEQHDDITLIIAKSSPSPQ